MEYLTCPNCQKRTPSVLTRCKCCGEKIDFSKVEERKAPSIRERNGFVSFYLWLGLIVNIIFAWSYFVLFFLPTGLFSATPEPFLLRFSWFFFSVIYAIGFIFLLNWRKVGFYICVIAKAIDAVGMTIISATGVFALINVAPIIYLILGIIPIVVLYGFLQITKDGVSCWDNLK